MSPLQKKKNQIEIKKLSKHTHHHLVFGDPAVWREVLEHGYKELQAAIPVAQQKHHANQIHNTHHCTGQVVGHMENLGKKFDS